MRLPRLSSIPLLFVSTSFASAFLTTLENTTQIAISNSRLTFSISKNTGAIEHLTLDKTNLLGTIIEEVPIPGGPTGNGKSGIGPYLDCFCIRNGTGSYTPGYIAPLYKTFNGSDASGTPYAGAVMEETFPSSGQVLSMFWVLRGEETGIHTFARVRYPTNPVGPTRSTLQEFRTLFRPNSELWTHLSVNDELAAILPKRESLQGAKVVQDATWDISASGNDPFVKEWSQYFTKYSFADTWREHVVHGLFGKDKTGTWGAWLVMNSRDTFYGGPGHSDLTVDGIVYNYMVSNHHGANVPNITAGFDRTFGPAYYHFNHGTQDTTLADLRRESTQCADPAWNRVFYDSVAQFVPGYIPPSKRGTFKGQFSLPERAKNAVVILSANGVDVQDNAASPNAYQYWSKIGVNGEATIPMVVPGKYRMTLQAEGVFGEFVQDGIEVGEGEARSLATAMWKEESAGQEIWRLGTPDRSAGGYRHGYAKDTNHTRAPQEYRIFWGAYDFQKDFPTGVRFKIGESVETRDWNYVHWSEFNGRGGDNVSDWRILWSQKNMTKPGMSAILTIQLAGVKATNGNTHVHENGEPWPGLPFYVLVNGRELRHWDIPFYHSSSCAIRQGISCYNTRNKFTFDAGLLRAGENEIVLRLPSKVRAMETSNLPGQVYVQYDALRLEIG